MISASSIRSRYSSTTGRRCVGILRFGKWTILFSLSVMICGMTLQCPSVFSEAEKTSSFFSTRRRYASRNSSGNSVVEMSFTSGHFLRPALPALTLTEAHSRTVPSTGRSTCSTGCVRAPSRVSPTANTSPLRILTGELEKFLTTTCPRCPWKL